jgi:hypothetical protein
MSVIRSFRKILSAVLAALLVLTFIGQVTDSVACAGEETAFAVSQLQHAGDPAALAQGTQNDHSEYWPDLGCTHGHCHHGVGMGLLNEQAPRQDFGLAMQIVSPVSTFHPSALQDRLLRPPRD